MSDLDLALTGHAILHFEYSPILSRTEDCANWDFYYLATLPRDDLYFHPISIRQFVGPVQEIKNNVRSLFFDAQGRYLCKTSGFHHTYSRTERCCAAPVRDQRIHAGTDSNNITCQEVCHHLELWHITNLDNRRS